MCYLFQLQLTPIVKHLKISFVWPSYKFLRDFFFYFIVRRQHCYLKPILCQIYFCFFGLHISFLKLVSTCDQSTGIVINTAPGLALKPGIILLPAPQLCNVNVYYNQQATFIHMTDAFLQSDLQLN